MKPYQVKLRVFGVLSLVAAVLVAFLPMYTEAKNTIKGAPDWLVASDYDTDTSTTPYTINLYSYGGEDHEITLAPTTIGASDEYHFKLTTPRVFQDCDVLEVLDVSDADASELTIMRSMFENCVNLDTLVLNDAANGAYLDTRSVTNMHSMFEGCESLKTLDLSRIDTSKVSDVGAMFKNCATLKTLDLSAFNLGAVQNTSRAADMFTGCDNLETIVSPTNVAVAIALPDGNAYYYYPDDDPSAKARTTKYLPLASEIGAGKSVTLRRLDAIEEVRFLENGDALETESVKKLIVGDTLELTADVTPSYATVTTLTAASNTQGVVALETAAGVSQSTAPVSLSAGGVLKITGKAQGEATITLTAAGPGLSGAGSVIQKETLRIVVARDAVDVTDVVVTPTSAVVDIDDGVYDGLKATVIPTNATLPTVTWSVRDGDKEIATIDSKTGALTLTGKKTGTVVATATTDDGGFTASATVTVQSSYGVTAKDERPTAEVTHASATEIASTEIAPVKGDRYLVISKSDGKSFNNALETQDATYFKLSFQDKNGATITGEDFGKIEVVLALPGAMWFRDNETPRIYSYSKLNGEAVVVAAERETLNGYVEAIRFTIDSTAIANEYALTMYGKNYAAYTIDMDDQRSNINYSSLIFRNERTTMSGNLHLHIREINESDARQLANVVNTQLDEYKVRHYYDIYMTNDAGEVVNNFTSCDLYISLPNDMDYTEGNLKVLSAHNGEVRSIGWNGRSDGYRYVYFEATHFSDYVMIFDQNGVANSFDVASVYSPVTLDEVPINNASQTNTSGGAGTGASDNNANTGGAANSQAAGNASSNAAGNASSGGSAGAGTSGSNTGASAGASGSGASGNSGASGGNTGGSGASGASGSNLSATSGASGSYTGGVVNYTGGNAADMPTTGVSHMYRALIVILLALSGAVELILSIPAKRKAGIA